MVACSVIVLNHNGKHFLKDCLQSLRQQTCRDFEVVLVDNASQDGSVEFTKNEFPDVRVLALTENHGFCGGNNAGIRDALARGSNSVLLLNNDTIAAPDFLEQMLQVLNNNPDAAVVCPKIFFAREPQLLWYAGAEFNIWTSRSRYTGWREEDTGKYDDIRPITQATGCAMLVRTSAIRDVGLLNERYFVYVEDLEWSVRFSQHGYSLLYAPKAHLKHFDGGTNVRSGSEFRRQYLSTRNLLFLCWEQARWWQWPTYLLGFLVFHAGFYSALRLKQRDYRAFWAIYRAIFDSLKSQSTSVTISKERSQIAQNPS